MPFAIGGKMLKLKIFFKEFTERVSVMSQGGFVCLFNFEICIMCDFHICVHCFFVCV